MTRWLHDGTAVGRALRRAAGQPAPGTLVVVRAGRARGLRWRVGVGNTTAYWRGHYERPVQDALAAALPAGGVFWDIGAHAGFYSGLAGIAGARHVLAVEPLAANLDLLQRLVADNQELQGRMTIVGAAAADAEGHGYLTAGASSSTGGLGDSGQPVALVTLDGLLARSGLPPDVVKIDVEGAEARVLDGAQRLLSDARPVLLLAVHGDALRAGCEKRLAGVGYRSRPLLSDLLLCRPAASALATAVSPKPRIAAPGRQGARSAHIGNL